MGVPLFVCRAAASPVGCRAQARCRGLVPYGAALAEFPGRVTVFHRGVGRLLQAGKGSLGALLAAVGPCDGPEPPLLRDDEFPFASSLDGTALRHGLPLF